MAPMSDGRAVGWWVLLQLVLTPGACTVVYEQSAGARTVCTLQPSGSIASGFGNGACRDGSVSASALCDFEKASNIVEFPASPGTSLLNTDTIIENPLVNVTGLDDMIVGGSDMMMESSSWNFVHTFPSTSKEPWCGSEEAGEDGVPTRTTSYESTDEGGTTASSSNSDSPKNSGEATESAKEDRFNFQGTETTGRTRKLTHQSVPKNTDFGKKFSDANIERDNITTLMIRNIHNMYTSMMLTQELDTLDFQDQYDFLYLPIDKSTQWNDGYAFVNFCSFKCFDHGFGKVVQLSIANTQGLERTLEYSSNTASGSIQVWRMGVMARPGHGALLARGGHSLGERPAVSRLQEMAIARAAAMPAVAFAKIGSNGAASGDSCTTPPFMLVWDVAVPAGSRCKLCEAQHRLGRSAAATAPHDEEHTTLCRQAACQLSRFWHLPRGGGTRWPTVRLWIMARSTQFTTQPSKLFSGNVPGRASRELAQAATYGSWPAWVKDGCGSNDAIRATSCFDKATLTGRRATAPRGAESTKPRRHAACPLLRFWPPPRGGGRRWPAVRLLIRSRSPQFTTQPSKLSSENVNGHAPGELAPAATNGVCLTSVDAVIGYNDAIRAPGRFDKNTPNGPARTHAAAGAVISPDAAPPSAHRLLGGDTAATALRGAESTTPRRHAAGPLPRFWPLPRGGGRLAACLVTRSCPLPRGENKRWLAAESWILSRSTQFTTQPSTLPSEKVAGPTPSELMRTVLRGVGLTWVADAFSYDNAVRARHFYASAPLRAQAKRHSGAPLCQGSASPSEQHQLSGNAAAPAPHDEGHAALCRKAACQLPRFWQLPRSGGKRWPAVRLWIMSRSTQFTTQPSKLFSGNVTGRASRELAQAATDGGSPTWVKDGCSSNDAIRATSCFDKDILTGRRQSGAHLCPDAALHSEHRLLGGSTAATAPRAANSTKPRRQEACPLPRFRPLPRGGGRRWPALRLLIRSRSTQFTMQPSRLPSEKVNGHASGALAQAATHGVCLTGVDDDIGYNEAIRAPGCFDKNTLTGWGSTPAAAGAAMGTSCFDKDTLTRRRHSGAHLCPDAALPSEHRLLGGDTAATAPRGANSTKSRRQEACPLPRFWPLPRGGGRRWPALRLLIRSRSTQFTMQPSELSSENVNGHAASESAQKATDGVCLTGVDEEIGYNDAIRAPGCFDKNTLTGWASTHAAAGAAMGWQGDALVVGERQGFFLSSAAGRLAPPEERGQ